MGRLPQAMHASCQRRLYTGIVSKYHRVRQKSGARHAALHCFLARQHAAAPEGSKAARPAASGTGRTKRHQALASSDHARRTPAASQLHTGRQAGANVVKHRSALAAGTAIHQRFQLPHIGRAQLLAHQQGLHLRKNAVLRHGWQEGRSRENGDTGHGNGQPFRCGFPPWSACRAPPQQTNQQAGQ